MSTQGLIGAGIGAALGAILWALIGYFTGYQIGYVAWAIGGLVGGIAAAMGGRGTQMGIVCAGLALLSIFIGKYADVHFTIGDEIEEGVAEIVTRDRYSEYMEDAKLFSAIESSVDYPQFMVDRQYTESAEAVAVPRQEVAAFAAISAPMLRRLHTSRPSFTAWSQRESAELEATVRGEISTMDEVTGSLGLIDIIFAMLGIGTAFKLGEGSPERERSTRTVSGSARRRRTGGLSEHADTEEPAPLPPPSSDKPGSRNAPVRRKRRR